MNISQTTLIHCSLPKAYKLAKAVERFPEFAKGYLASKVVSKLKKGLIVERKVQVQDQILTWKSLMSTRDRNHISYTQLEGPLKGLKADWFFREQKDAATELTITHELEIKELAESQKIEKTVSTLTDQFLKDITKWMESQ